MEPTGGPTEREPTCAGPSGAGPSGGEPGPCRLVVACTDRPGIVAAVSSFLAGRGANIVASDQHSTDPTGGRFFLRVVFRPESADRWDDLQSAFASEVAGPYGMTHRMRRVAEPSRVTVFVSRQDHCLLDLLWRHRRGELPVEIVRVVSNHPDLADAVAAFGVPFTHVAVTRDGRAEAEARQLDLLAADGTELVVLARYMQILSAGFLASAGIPVINIHHSFLPAFAGAAPYEQARRRGVKIIGATAHYATEDLDEGPIIEQDVARASHREDAAGLAARGAGVERTVLARAVRWHCEDRVLVDGRTTIVF